MLAFTKLYLFCESFVLCLVLELFKNIVAAPKPAFLSWVDLKLAVLG